MRCGTATTRLQGIAVFFAPRRWGFMLNNIFKNKAPSSPVQTGQTTPPQCGYLMKLGQHHKTWKERWFVINNGRLYYYKSKDTDRPLGEIAIHESHCRVSREFYPQRLCFEIVTPTRVFQLIAKSPDSMSTWMAEVLRHSFVARDNEVILSMEDMISKGESQTAYMMQHSVAKADGNDGTSPSSAPQP